MRIYIPETGVTRAICAVVEHGFAYVAASYSHQTGIRRVDGSHDRRCCNGWKNDGVVFIGFDWRPNRERFFHYINI